MLENITLQDIMDEMNKYFKFVNNNTYAYREQSKQVVLDHEIVNSLGIFVKLSQPSSRNTMQKVPVMHFYSNNAYQLSGNIHTIYHCIRV